MGFTFQRMYATNVASARRTAVVAAELASPRTVCRLVALTITIISHAAAPDTSHGLIRVMPGRVVPIAAKTSATPMKIRRAGGIDAFICSTISAGGLRKSMPCAKNATASNVCSTLPGLGDVP